MLNEKKASLDSPNFVGNVTITDEDVETATIIPFTPRIEWDNSQFSGVYIMQKGMCIKGKKTARMLFDIQISSIGSVASEEEFLHISGFPIPFLKVRDMDYSGSMYSSGMYGGCVYTPDPAATGLDWLY